MKKIVVILISVLCLTGAEQLIALDPPQWIEGLKHDVGYFYGIGQAEGKRESLIDALSELHRETRDNKYVSENDRKVFEIDLEIGEVKVFYLESVFIQIGNTEISTKVLFAKNNMNLEYDQYTEYRNNEIIFNYIKIFEKECTLTNLINELQNAGCIIMLPKIRTVV